ncbi:MAG: thioredoxin family protein [Nibricoccus sp.]
MKKIQILGGGCAKCAQLYANTEAAAKALNLEYRIEKISDFQQIAKAGVMTTPGLVVDGVVKSSGKLLSADQIKALLS